MLLFYAIYISATLCCSLAKIVLVLTIYKNIDLIFTQSVLKLDRQGLCLVGMVVRRTYFHYKLRRLDTSARFSTILKGDNFCDFLIAVPGANPLLSKGLL